MCQALPGPRCSSHTRERMDNLRVKHQELQNEFNRVLREEWNNAPSGSKKRDRVQKKLDSLIDRIGDVQTRAHINYLDYCGTPAGLKALEAARESAKTEGEKRDITLMMRRAKMLRSWRESAARKPKGSVDLNMNLVVDDIYARMNMRHLFSSAA